MKKVFLNRIFLLLSFFMILLMSYSVINANESVPILFWGDGCPHCAEVKEEINNTPSLSEIEIDYKEIYNNKENADLFMEKIEECEFSPYQAGVPMLYYANTCWMGKYEVLEGLEYSITGESSRSTSQQIPKEDTSLQVDRTTVESDSQNDVLEEEGSILKYILPILLCISLVILFVVIKKKKGV